MQMQGKTAGVAGATAGIGLTTARRLAEQGANVVIVARNRERIDSTLALLREKGPGGQHQTFQTDLALVAEVARVGAELGERRTIPLMLTTPSRQARETSCPRGAGGSNPRWW